MKQQTKKWLPFLLAAALAGVMAWYYNVYTHWNPKLFPVAVVASVLVFLALAVVVNGKKWLHVLGWLAAFLAVQQGVGFLVNNVIYDAMNPRAAMLIVLPLLALLVAVLLARPLWALSRKARRALVISAIALVCAGGIAWALPVLLPKLADSRQAAEYNSQIEKEVSEMEKLELADIGGRIEMFVDDYLIARAENVQLRLHKPQPGEIALAMDQPWEGEGSGVYSTVFSDGEKYRMYYRAIAPDNEGGDRGESQFCCYAESTDGIRWERKNLGLVEFHGSKDNNIVFAGVGAHNFAPWLDENPACPADEKYKAVCGLSGEGDAHGLMAYKSADGFAWVKLQDKPVITEGAFDSLNGWFWDTNTSSYRCYSRYWTGGDSGIRAIQSSTSADFRSWSEQASNSYDEDAPLEHFYTNATVLCPGAEHFYLSFPMRFVPERKKLVDYPDTGVSDAVFITSRDGTHFQRAFMEPWIAPGLDPRNWTQRNFITANGILETSAEEFSLYVNEHYGWDDSFIRRYTVRRHGFGSMYADYRGGRFTTRPILFDGDALCLNYATSAAGGIRIGILDEEGKPLRGFHLEDCDEIYGNELEKMVTWKGKDDVSKLRGQPVRLVVELRDADLFALRFSGMKDAPQGAS